MNKLLLVIAFLFVRLGMSAQGLPANIEGQTLPYTWEMPFMNGKIVSTLVEDGTIYSQSITPCVLCSASGMCQVCYGTGGTILAWYGDTSMHEMFG